MPRKARHDGWTPARQRAFIAGLMETGCVDRACKRIGMSAVGAYLLRRQPGAEDFARVWAEAQAFGVARLEDVAFDRAINGVAVPVFYKGEKVGERTLYNDRLLMWTLRHHDPDRYGGPVGNRVPPHIRRALRREWEAERAIEDEARARAEAAEKAAYEAIHGTPGERVARRLEEMERRMRPDRWVDGVYRDPAAAEAPPAADRTPDAAPPAELTEPPPAPAPLTTPPRAGPDVRANWAEWHRRRAIARAADPTSSDDPRDGEQDALERWEALVEAGLIGGGEAE